jgi:hypothetical protein
MEQNYKSCNFLYADVIDASVPYYPIYFRIYLQAIKGLNRVKFSLYSQFRNILYPQKNKEIMTNIMSSQLSENESLNLQPGECVQVRSIDEISATLDGRKKYKGLYFMPEMEKFCGKKFKVFKKVGTIKLESTGEVRKLRSPSVFLEGVYCNGERHEGCDRACFHFWREAWLKRIERK